MDVRPGWRKAALFLALWRPVPLAQISMAKNSSKNLTNRVDFATLCQWTLGTHVSRHMV